MLKIGFISDAADAFQYLAKKATICQSASLTPEQIYNINLFDVRGEMKLIPTDVGSQRFDVVLLNDGWYCQNSISKILKFASKNSDKHDFRFACMSSQGIKQMMRSGLMFDYVVAFCGNFDLIDVQSMLGAIEKVSATKNAKNILIISETPPLHISDSVSYVRSDRNYYDTLASSMLECNGHLALMVNDGRDIGAHERAIVSRCISERSPNSVEVFDRGLNETKRTLFVKPFQDQLQKPHSNDALHAAIILNPSQTAESTLESLTNIESRISKNAILYIAGPRNYFKLPRWIEDNDPFGCISNLKVKLDVIYIYEDIALRGHESLSSSFIKDIYSQGVPQILVLKYSGEIVSLSEFSSFGPSRILLHSTEVIFPIQRAFQARIFDLGSSLLRSGLSTAMHTLNRSKTSSTREACSAISTFFTEYQESQFVSEKINRNKKTYGIMERALRVSSDNANPIIEHLENNPSIDVVIFTCAYHEMLVRIIRKKFRKRKIFFICDTLDVFFQIARDEEKLTKMQEIVCERDEINALNIFDLVIYISESDKIGVELAAKRNGMKIPNGIVESGNFGYIRFLGDPQDNGNVLKLGYIGSSNKFNKMAIAMISESWIPSLLHISDNITFSVAGAVSQTDESLNLKEKYPDFVQLLGRVDDLSQFYYEQHVMLGPAMVQGGLNFKNAEALMAGRHVLTNEIGRQCISRHPGVLVMSPESIHYIKEMMESRNFCSLSIRESAEREFSEKNAYRSVVDYIKRTYTQ